MSMLYLRIAAVAIIIATGWYVKYLIGENAVLEQQIIAERAALQDFATEVTADINGYKVALSTVMTGYQKHDEEKSRLETILAKHDLGELAKRKPGLVASRINAGTASVFMAIESASEVTTSADDAGDTEAIKNTP